MKKITAVILLALAAFIGLYSYFLPESIAIEQGKSSTLEFSLPLRASISGGDIQVLNINNRPAGENPNFAPSGTVLSADGSGHMQMSLTLFGLPIKNVSLTVLPRQEYVPVGETVGIVLDTNGVLVLGTGKVRDAAGNEYEPCRGLLRSGDMIKSVNGTEVFTKEELIEAVRSDSEHTAIVIDRLDEPVEIDPIISKDGIPMIGLWVRDSTQGIGTVTYYRKSDLSFGALGHPVTDIDTGELMEIKEGTLYPVLMQGIVKGEKGMAGELAGRNADNETILGKAEKNCGAGIYGTLTPKGERLMRSKPVPIALKESVHKGPASILADVDGNGVKEYAIEIEGINSFSKNTSKGMIISITDQNLIKKTGGIVQGMSGSPIIQDGCLVGAVTHVFIQNPTRGYGVFIENMIVEN